MAMRLRWARDGPAPITRWRVCPAARARFPTELPLVLPLRPLRAPCHRDRATRRPAGGLARSTALAAPVVSVPLLSAYHTLAWRELRRACRPAASGAWLPMRAAARSGGGGTLMAGEFHSCYTARVGRLCLVRECLARACSLLALPFVEGEIERYLVPYRPSRFGASWPWRAHCAGGGNQLIALKLSSCSTCGRGSLHIRVGRYCYGSASA